MILLVVWFGPETLPKNNHPPALSGLGISEPLPRSRAALARDDFSPKGQPEAQASVCCCLPHGSTPDSGCKVR